MKKRNYLAIGIVVALGGVSTASFADEVINACVDKKGKLRIVDAGEACKRKEQALSWNIQGPQGPEGPQAQIPDPILLGHVLVDADSVALCDQYYCDPVCLDYARTGSISEKQCLTIEETGNRWVFDETGQTSIMSLLTPYGAIYYTNASCTGTAYAGWFSGTLVGEKIFSATGANDTNSSGYYRVASEPSMESIPANELWSFSRSTDFNGEVFESCFAHGQGPSLPRPVTSDFYPVDISDYLPTDYVAVPVREAHIYMQ